MVGCCFLGWLDGWLFFGWSVGYLVGWFLFVWLVVWLTGLHYVSLESYGPPPITRQ